MILHGNCDNMKTYIEIIDIILPVDMKYGVRELERETVMMTY